MWEHIQMSLLALVIAVVVAVPIAVVLAHRRIGGSLVVAAVNIGRAVPSFAVVAVALPLTIRLGLGLGFWPTMIALLFLAVPPLFSNAHTGVSGVDPAMVDAARGMGMTGRQVMTHVEVPLAMPVMVAGARIAAVQIVATATLGALVAWGGLGRYIIDGFATQDIPEVVAGGILVALLAIVTEGAFSVVERIISRRSHGHVDVREVLPVATSD
ncbi:MAG: ABC transporter permease [Acidimicrobiia bacterium]|nr:ABC transporter permease [Acidimicrobiia bacterium]